MKKIIFAALSLTLFLTACSDSSNSVKGIPPKNGGNGSGSGDDADAASKAAELDAQILAYVKETNWCSDKEGNRLHVLVTLPETNLVAVQEYEILSDETKELSSNNYELAVEGGKMILTSKISAEDKKVLAIETKLDDNSDDLMQLTLENSGLSAEENSKVYHRCDVMAYRSKMKDASSSVDSLAEQAAQEAQLEEIPVEPIEESTEGPR